MLLFKKQGHYIQNCFKKKIDEKERKVNNTQGAWDLFVVLNDVNNVEVLLVYATLSSNE